MSRSWVLTIRPDQLVQRAQGRAAALRTVGDGGQEGHRADRVQAEQGVGDGDAQAVSTRGRQMEPVAAGNGEVAAARAPADVAAEGTELSVRRRSCP
jgi:hypothetical protein